MTLEELQEVLLEFSKKHNLKQAATSCCLIYISNCLKDGPGSLNGYKRDDIRIEFIKHEMIFEHYFYKTPFIKTRMGLYKKEADEAFVRNLEAIGYYELDTNTEGESFDDWLVIDEVKH